MISLSTTVAFCALAYGLILAHAVCRTLVFIHTERADALRSIHARLRREAALPLPPA